MNHTAIRRTVARRLRACPAFCAAFAIGTAACAPAAQSPLSQPDVERTVSVSGPEFQTEHTLRRGDFVGLSELPVDRATAWPLLRQAWEDVGLPEPTVDDRTFTLTVTNHVLTRRLGRTALSTYLSCGRSVSGWNADSYRVRLTVRTMLESLGSDVTRVHTRVDATASPTEGTSTARVECASHGALEQEIAARLRQRLGVR